MLSMEKEGEIVIFQSGSGEINVKMEGDSLWLSQRLLADLFEKDSDTIGVHLKNIYTEGELDENSTTEFFSVVQHEGNRKVNRKIKYYNLDAIISVGYRVSSKKGTQFRLWANQVLKDYLTNGYSINERKLTEQSRQLAELKQTVKLLGNVIENKSLSSDEATGLLRVVTDYAYALDVLDQYDHQLLRIHDTTSQELFQITYKAATAAIKSLKDKFGGSKLFGNEKDESFQSSLAAIYQTFGGRDLYPSVEEKASNLLYFVIKNHSFSDGNKRIGAFLFVWFLEKNNLLYRPDGTKRIADNALVALTLMIAESKPTEKEMIIKVVVNLINIKN
jgi:prophage maintenance system killer protein